MLWTTRSWSLAWFSSNDILKALSFHLLCRKGFLKTVLVCGTPLQDQWLYYCKCVHEHPNLLYILPLTGKDVHAYKVYIKLQVQIQGIVKRYFSALELNQWCNFNEYPQGKIWCENDKRQSIINATGDISKDPLFKKETRLWWVSHLNTGPGSWNYSISTGQ